MSFSRSDRVREDRSRIAKRPSCKTALLGPLASITYRVGDIYEPPVRFAFRSELACLAIYSSNRYS